MPVISHPFPPPSGAENKHQLTTHNLLNETCGVTKTFQLTAFDLPADQGTLAGGAAGWRNFTAADRAGLSANGWEGLPLDPGGVPGGAHMTWGGAVQYYLDGETGLYADGAEHRLYDPNPLKFVSEDPPPPRRRRPQPVPVRPE
jgi:hypothetical protein